MPPIGLLVRGTRFVFRSRYVAMLWAAGVCFCAAEFAGDRGHASIDAASSADGNTAQAQALAAEEE